MYEGLNATLDIKPTTDIWTVIGKLCASNKDIHKPIDIETERKIYLVCQLWF